MSAPETPSRVAVLNDLARTCANQAANAMYEPAARALAQASATFAILAADLAVTTSWPGIVGPHPDPRWRGLHADDVAETLGLARDTPLDVLRDELRAAQRTRPALAEARCALDEMLSFRNETAELVGITPSAMTGNAEILDALRWRDDLMATRLREERERSEARRSHLAGILAAVEPVLDAWEVEDTPHRGIGTGLSDALDRLAAGYAALPNPPAAPDPTVAVDVDRGPWIRPQDRGDGEGVTENGADVRPETSG